MNEQEWLTCEDPQRMLAVLTGHAGYVTPISDRKLRLFACACCRRYKPLTPAGADELEQKGERHGLTDTQWAQAWARGEGKETAPTRAAILREIVGNPFHPIAMWPGPKTAEVAARLARTPDSKIIHLHRGIITPLVRDLAEAAYRERSLRRCHTCAGSGELATSHKFDCYDCHGTGTISNGTLDPDRLAVLSDALEEAGCDNVDLLMHLRGQERCPQCLGGIELADPCNRCGAKGLIPKHSPCYRGCAWLDLLLGKE